MGEEADTVELEHERVGNKFKVTARRQGTAVFIDSLDPANATQRQRFIKALKAKLPQADPGEIDAELLRLADSTSTDSTPPGASPEIDVSCVLRPEQFYTPDVAGLAVPVPFIRDGQPAARWMLYLRWADGRRECRELTSCINLPSESRLWIYPTPGEPSMNSPPGWSAGARQQWLGNAAAPDPAELFKRICQRIASFIDFPHEVAVGTTATLALWVMLTYIYQAWGAIPYLFVGGPLGSGKSRVFEILARLVFRPLTTSNLTAPALFRTLNDRGGVVVFDEAERLRQSTPDVQEILSMFLAGYKRGGKATRLEAVGDTWRPVEFDVYGPKALACIAGLPTTLSSRCIPVTMFRAAPDSPKPRYRIDADPEGWQRLRDDLHALALEHGAVWLQLARRSDVCPSGLSGRAYELWQPLLALASWIESHGAIGLLDLLRQHALAAVEANRDDQTPEADEVLLEELTQLVRLGHLPTPGEILDKAKERDPRTFDKWVAQTISRRLKSYGIATPKKSHGERRYRDVTLDTLLRIQRHYGIDLGITDNVPRPKSSPPIDPLATPARP
jgi:hypothetical protein